eukprot:TRINITY_DN46172_c0_g1_i1.p2 TRINITY_DN46172_c0_g1~~TRINITY_DN46172_c0_g1_i1.p2  ORF type:complete len:114 (+),score=20.95 TRINITY_DN46172_c0_g1_i1:73-414(+)
MIVFVSLFFLNDTAPTEIYTILFVGSVRCVQETGTIVILGIITIINKELGFKSLGIVAFSFKEMVLVIPPVFMLLGLLDVWVPRETMIKYMGCLLYTSPSPRDRQKSRMPSSA